MEERNKNRAAKFAEVWGGNAEAFSCAYFTGAYWVDYELGEVTFSNEKVECSFVDAEKPFEGPTFSFEQITKLARCLEAAIDD